MMRMRFSSGQELHLQQGRQQDQNRQNTPIFTFA